MFLCSYLIELMFHKLHVQAYSPFCCSDTTWFKCNCLCASLLAVLLVVYAIVRLSSGKTMVLIFHQPHRGVCPCHGLKMKNQYLFLEFNKAMWHRLNTAQNFEFAINCLAKIQADKNRYPIRVHHLTIDQFQNKNKRPHCIKVENGPLIGSVLHQGVQMSG